MKILLRLIKTKTEKTPITHISNKTCNITMNPTDIKKMKYCESLYEHNLLKLTQQENESLSCCMLTK